MRANAGQLAVHGVRKLLKAKYNGLLRKNFDRKGIPCKEDCVCGEGPCCDWEDLLESELSSTFYVDMQDSIRLGTVHSRGSRGGRKQREEAKLWKRRTASESDDSSAKEGV